MARRSSHGLLARALKIPQTRREGPNAERPSKKRRRKEQRKRRPTQEQSTKGCSCKKPPCSEMVCWGYTHRHLLHSTWAFYTTRGVVGEGVRGIRGDWGVLYNYMLLNMVDHYVYITRKKGSWLIYIAGGGPE